MWDTPFRSPGPDSPSSISSTSFHGSAREMFDISSFNLQATDLSPGELVSRYRERLAQPRLENPGARDRSRRLVVDLDSP